MSSTPTRCIVLTKELEHHLRTQIASRHYASASEVARSALRLLIEREQAVAGGKQVAEKLKTSRASV